MHFVVDWDGTATEHDTLLAALRHFVPARELEPLERELDAGLASGTPSHREVMEREWRLVRAPLDDVVAFVRANARLRSGFADFVRRYDPLIVSSSFHETIEPVLEREGIDANVRANHAIAQSSGWRIDWTSDAGCRVCGEPCKRAALPAGEVVFIGDGYSDRCAALAAGRVYARAGLAQYLDERRHPYVRFDDFETVTRSLA